MTAEQKKQLQQKLWDIANELRGKMAADQFRDYILGLIFYKYLSERMYAHANRILGEKYPSFTKLAGHDQEEKLKQAVKTSALKVLGYYLAPEELFSELAVRGGRDEFILSDLSRVLNHIQDSTMGTESEQDFVGLFEDVDLGHPKLGRTEEQKNELIAKVIVHLQAINFGVDGDDSHANEELLGDAYEYLIGQFASGAGKKAGEFYTPASVSTVLAKIVTLGKDSVQSVYDPTCGSGSLMLRVAREVSGETRPKFYGQEMNRTTFNLARMNMLLHGVHFSDFDIRQEDTLTRPAPEHEDKQFEAIVANPPFSAKWSAHEVFNTDDRYSQYGRLAPKSKADFAFVQHMLHHLDENGTMAVILPHGVLFRGAAEAHIRKYIVEERNWLDAIIGLPANLFYGTDKKTCILIFKKCREDNENIMFFDASTFCTSNTPKNILDERNIEKVLDIYTRREFVEKVSYIASLEEVKENDYNLYIPRYVENRQIEPEYKLESVLENAQRIFDCENKIDKLLRNKLTELNLSLPKSNNLQNWRAYRAFIVQSLFSQKLRFKKEDGGAYLNWSRAKLSHWLTETGLKSTGEESVHSVSVHKGLIDQVEHLGRSYSAANTSHYGRVRPGDIVYTKSPTGDFPLGVVKQSKLKKDAIVSPLYGIYEPESYELGYLIDALFAIPEYSHNYLHRIVQKGVKNTISCSDRNFLTGEITLPQASEETDKIYKTVSYLDQKIALLEADNSFLKANMELELLNDKIIAANLP